MSYEKDYHKHLHGHLSSDEEYYKARANLAVEKYFNNIPKESKILEFGCGLGQNIINFPNAIGYDISKYSLDFCRNKGIKVVDDLKDIEDNSCDVVFSAHVLEHLENPSEAIKQMHSKLKPSGKLILILPLEKPRKVKQFNLEVSQHLFAWTFKTINNLLVKNNFKIESNEYLRGEGYKRLLILNKYSPKSYNFATQLAAFINRNKEMKVVAEKA